MQKQVDADHYAFGKYMDLPRWSSLWHQLREVEKLGGKSVVEIGPGAGYFKALAGTAGIHVETVDIDPDLRPDHIGEATRLPLPDRSFDVACAFQVLEHLPFAQALAALDELARVARRHVVISLPDSRQTWRYSLHVPKFGEFRFLVNRPRLGAPLHVFDGQHRWEIGKRGYELEKVTASFLASGRLRLERTFRPFENAYHRFFVFSVVDRELAEARR